MVKEHLQVYARIKPVDRPREVLQNLSISDTTLDLQVARTKLSNAKDNQSYTFTKIFNQNATQQDIFVGTTQAVVDNCLQGYNGTIFAYGQTGSGKTFTMSGGDDWQQRGVIPRVLSYIFQQFNKKSQSYSFQLQASFIQIYNQNAYDLLQERHVQSNFEEWSKIIFMEDEEGSLQMKNVATHIVQSQQQALNLHMMGNFIRKTNATALNQTSSRSHCIFTLNISSRNKQTFTQCHSKLHLVDLAGSERVSRSQAQGIVLTEAKSINLSLTYLQQVIVSLNQKSKSKSKPHIPYRNSLLTTILKDSLGGNCKTVMIATVSVDKSNLQQTISTLRFSQRVRLIQNQASKNEKNIYSGKIQMLQRENAMLKKKLSSLQGVDTDLSLQNESQLVQRYMNSNYDLQIKNISQAKRYMNLMRETYQSKLSEYVRQLTFISHKLARYQEIVTEKQKKRGG